MHSTMLENVSNNHPNARTGSLSRSTVANAVYEDFTPIRSNPLFNETYIDVKVDDNTDHPRDGIAEAEPAYSQPHSINNGYGWGAHSKNSNYAAVVDNQFNGSYADMSDRTLLADGTYSSAALHASHYSEPMELEHEDGATVPAVPLTSNIMYDATSYQASSEYAEPTPRADVALTANSMYHSLTDTSAAQAPTGAGYAEVVTIAGTHGHDSTDHGAGEYAVPAMQRLDDSIDDDCLV